LTRRGLADCARGFARRRVPGAAPLAPARHVHSVHHASDGDPVACPTASFAAHVDGITAAALALDAPVHLVGAVAVPSGRHLASLRSLDPSQPRAPPAPLV
jgi:hypothetical protein